MRHANLGFLIEEKAKNAYFFQEALARHTHAHVSSLAAGKKPPSPKKELSTNFFLCFPISQTLAINLDRAT